MKSYAYPLLGAMVCVLAGTAWALLDAPGGLMAVDNGDGTVSLSWEQVDGAEKYAVEVCASVTLTDDGAMEYVVDVCVEETTTDLAATVDVLAAALDALPDDVNPDDIVSAEGIGTAKVKGLNPGRGNGRQNHPQASADVSVSWSAP